VELSPLPATEREALQVASFFEPVEQYTEPTANEPRGIATVFTGRGACEGQVKRLFGAEERNAVQPRWRYLLFSTHALADRKNGMYSSIALAAPVSDSPEDGFLEAQEVLDLDLDCDLAMLSACRTGLGNHREGEGYVGLSTAFFCAGSESVCVSLWSVPTGPTTQLVTEFFRHIKEGKLSRAEALRQAQLTVLREGRSPNGKPSDYSDPFCWAPFVLVGEYR